jgi:hypothetical protein
MSEVAMREVESSQISKIGYDKGNRMLYVEFKKSGKVYRYHDVGNAVYEELLHHKSKGFYFNNFIKEKYSFMKL